MNRDVDYRSLLVGSAAAGAALWLLRARRSAGAHTAAGTGFDDFLRMPAPQTRVESIGTGFESFLRVPPPATAATDFASFLRTSNEPVPHASFAAAPQPAAAADLEPPPPDACPVLVVYGTEYGFAREIAEKLTTRLRASSGKYWPYLADAAEHSGGSSLSLPAHRAALLIFSTHGDGVPPSEARPFCDWLTAGGPGPLTSLRYSVCALGDTAYAHFCACGRTLDAALASAGATALAPRAEVDKEDWAVVDAWVEAALAGLDAAVAAGDLPSLAELGAGAPPLPAAAAGTTTTAGGAPARVSRSRPAYARVLAVEGLCTLSGPEDKDTVRLELELTAGPGGDDAPRQGLHYEPGDALGIWPTNSPELVQELLTAAGMSGDEAVPAPTWHYAEEAEHRVLCPDADGAVQLAAALAVAYDLHTPRGRDLLLALADAADAGSGDTPANKPPGRRSVELHADATGGVIDAGDKDTVQCGPTPPMSATELRALAGSGAALSEYLAPRHVADVLRDAPAGALLTPQQLLACLRPLAPRLYSISSSPLEYDPPGSRVAATIAVVRYTSLECAREGVASCQAAARLRPGDVLPVFVAPNPDFRLPASNHTPIIMVGPGTGLAPFRAFVAHRLACLAVQGVSTCTAGPQPVEQQQEAVGDDAARQCSDKQPPANTLFFGCRRPDQDFLYGPLLTSWAEAGALRLHTAFSRAGPAKVYVQQRMAEAADEVWAALQAGGHFYVCGDAGAMAPAVEAALLDLLAQRLSSSGSSAEGVQAAAAYLARLSAEGRYQRDVWLS